MRDLSEIRVEIDEIDRELIALFKRRMDCARDVGYYKKANNVPILNAKREEEILDSVEEKGGEYGGHEDFCIRILWSFQELYSIIL